MNGLGLEEDVHSHSSNKLGTEYGEYLIIINEEPWPPQDNTRRRSECPSSVCGSPSDSRRGKAAWLKFPLA